MLLSIPITTFGLGVWQVRRKSEKEALVAALEARLGAAPLPLPTEDYPPVARERTRKACCGGRSYWCKHCGRTFDKSWNWIRHVRTVHKRQRK